MSGKWDFETTVKFIQLYKLHPCIWDFSSKDYKNKQKRDAAFNAITEEINISGFGVQEVKNKIKNLRSTYSQEIKKIQDSKKSGAGLSNVYVSNIKWLDEMEEIFAKNLKRQVYENVNDINNEATESQASGFVVPTSNSTSVAESSQETPRNEEVTLSTSSTSNVGNTPRPKKRSRDIVKAISDLKKINDDVNSEVETVWDAFGKSVAMQLKIMSVENALLAQCKLQTVLTEYGLKDHRGKTRSSSATSNYRPSSVLSDFTDNSFVNTPNIYLDESVTSPVSPAPAPGRIIFATQPTIETSTEQIIFTPSHAMDSSPTQLIYTTQPTIETSTEQIIFTPSHAMDSSPTQLIYTTQPAQEQHPNSDEIIITAAINAASAFQSNYEKK